jgi:hypothetical protein
MYRNRLVTGCVIAVLGLVIGTGCPGRKEVIKIAGDGTVTMHLTYSGTAAEIGRFDALPSARTGWDVSKTVKTDGDEEEHIVEAKQAFAPGAALPSQLVADDEPDADLCLEFPTSLWTEERADGVYYRFHRVYVPRRWAYVEYWRNWCFGDDTDKLVGKPREELTLEEKVKIAQAFACAEALHRLELALVALEEFAPDLPPEYPLLARQAAIQFYEDMDIDETIARCEQAPEDERQECFNREAERILAEGHAAFVQSLLTDAGLSALDIARFEDAFERAQKYYEITSELGGHFFEIEVSMPGELIAHNGEVDESDDGDTVEWSFQGDAFRDRPHELIAISRVVHDAGVEP